MARLSDHMKARERELESYDVMAANGGDYRVDVTETANDGRYGGVETVKTYELAPYIEEQRQVMVAYFEAANDVKSETGRDILTDSVEDLGSHDGMKVGGVFNTGSKEVKLDTNVAEAAVQSIKGVEQLKQVGLHESIHWEAHTNAEKRGEPMLNIVNTEFEEAMCETATSLVTGEVMAYKELMGGLAKVASSAGKSSAEVALMYREGRFTELNMMCMAAYPEKVAV